MFRNRNIDLSNWKKSNSKWEGLPHLIVNFPSVMLFKLSVIVESYFSESNHRLTTFCFQRFDSIFFSLSDLISNLISNLMVISVTVITQTKNRFDIFKILRFDTMCYNVVLINSRGFVVLVFRQRPRPNTRRF